VSGLARLMDEGVLDAYAILAIMGKTEGNGCVNDFTREYATTALATCLAPRLRLTATEVERRIAFVMSGGTEGVLSPHITVFARRSTPNSTQKQASGQKRLAIGIAHTREFLPEELGRRAQIDETAKAVAAAMLDAGIDTAADVHFVQIKCPLLTAERMSAARARGQSVVTEDTYASMGYSRGASALGVALALGEMREMREMSNESLVLSDWNAYSKVASTSAGIELMCNVVIVMGNTVRSASRYVIGHAVMHDAIDLAAVIAGFRNAGIDPYAPDVRARLVNVFAKAEAAPSGEVRGARHTMLDDSDINSTRHARAAVGGLIAGVAGTGLVYVSGGAEHQGPPGGGPIAVIARADD